MITGNTNGNRQMKTIVKYRIWRMIINANETAIAIT